MRRWVERMPTVVLGRSYRSVDNELNQFLAAIRTVQPPKARVAAFFGPRALTYNLRKAVEFGIFMQKRYSTAEVLRLFTWLTVTNAGAEQVNLAAIRSRGVTEAELSPMAGDPRVVQERQRLYLAEGLTMRLTRNLDKDRGFVNGAIGIIKDRVCGLSASRNVSVCQ